MQTFLVFLSKSKIMAEKNIKNFKKILPKMQFLQYYAILRTLPENFCPKIGKFSLKVRKWSKKGKHFWRLFAFKNVLFGHVECSLENPSGTFSPIGGNFLGSIYESDIEFFFLKSFFPSYVPVDTWIALLRTLQNIFCRNAENLLLKMEERSY